jgi:hypothetical protein
MFVVRTSKHRADSLGQLIGTEQTVGFDHFSLAVNPFGFDCVEPRTLLGQQTTDDPHPFLLAFFRARLLLPIHRLTSRLMCQLALSQINTNTFLPRASSFWQHHSKKRVVIELTGQPSTKRTHAS